MLHPPGPPGRVYIHTITHCHPHLTHTCFSCSKRGCSAGTNTLKWGQIGRRFDLWTGEGPRTDRRTELEAD